MGRDCDKERLSFSLYKRIEVYYYTVMKREMTEFVKKLRAKGWTAQALAKHWGVTPRRISQIGANPKQIHWDAMEHLPVIKKEG